jgi:hypothetical protein
VGLLLSGSAAFAGGPLVVRDDGAPYVWPPGAIAYRTDNAPLSATVNEAAARTRVANMFAVWQNVATASISYTRAGFISPVGAYTGGDVNTIDEFNAVDGDCGAGNQSPIIYDTDGSIFVGLGLDETSIIGFAGPCASSATQIISGGAVMNGLFQDGDDTIVTDLPLAGFDTAFIHEFGHFSGLDHSQINVSCAAGCVDPDLLAGLPTMFPFLVDLSQQTLSDDDIAWISRLYPQTTGGTTLANTYGTITGTVLFSDGLSHVQGVNVIACRVGAGSTSVCSNAVSVVSGFKFTPNPGQSVTANYLPCTPASDCPPNGFFDDNSGGSPSGSRQSGDIGYFELSVPSGFAYTVGLQTIDPSFDEASSVGPLSPPIPMPGTAPPAVITAVVNDNATVSVGNLVLVGTDPRFDQFEGP